MNNYQSVIFHQLSIFFKACHSPAKANLKKRHQFNNSCHSANRPYLHQARYV